MKIKIEMSPNKKVRWTAEEAIQLLDGWKRAMIDGNMVVADRILSAITGLPVHRITNLWEEKPDMTEELLSLLEAEQREEVAKFRRAMYIARLNNHPIRTMVRMRVGRSEATFPMEDLPRVLRGMKIA